MTRLLFFLAISLACSPAPAEYARHFESYLSSIELLEDFELNELKRKVIDEYVGINSRFESELSNEEAIYQKFGRSRIYGARLKHAPYAFLVIWEVNPETGRHEIGTEDVFVIRYEGFTTTQRAGKFQRYSMDFSLSSIQNNREAAQPVRNVFFSLLDGIQYAEDIRRSKDPIKARNSRLNHALDFLTPASDTMFSQSEREGLYKGACFRAMMRDFY